MKQPSNRKTEALKIQFVDKQAAYTDIEQGTRQLLAMNTLFWTECLLLKLANRIAQKRLAQLAKVMPNGE